MAEVNDRGFGGMALRLKFLTAEQLTETLDVQKKMREMGVDAQLGEILVKKGFLTDAQRREVLKAMGIAGSAIPGYALQHKIAAGGMGTVYRAMQESMNRPVAVKILSNLYTKDPSYVARFLREARAAAALDHKNIIRAIDVGHAADTFYFIMEFVDGKTVRQVMDAEGCLGQARSVDIGIQVAEALQYVHQNKMVHRDIKPENLMITADGTVKICDFGLARGVDREQSLTLDGVIVGTPYYMSPEQIQMQPDIDIRGDLYALGATLYFLAAGQWVFEGKTAALTFRKHLDEAPLDPRKHNPKLTEDFALVLLKCLQKDRKDRYQTPQEMVDDLRKVKAGQPVVHARAAAAAPKGGTRKHGESQRRMRVVRAAGGGGGSATGAIVGVVAAIVVIAVLILVLRGGGGQDPKPIVKPPETTVPATTDRPPPPVEDDPAMVSKAAELWTRAQDDVKSGRWEDGRRRLEQLQKEHAALQYVRSRGEAIGEALGACKSGLEKAAAEGRRAYDEAMGLVDQSKFKEAKAALSAIRAGPGVSADALADANASVDRELEADEAARLLAKWFGMKRWSSVIEQASQMRQKYLTTKTYKSVVRAIGQMEEDSRSEMDAEEALRELRVAASKSEWMQALEALEKLERHSKTHAYADRDDEIAALRKQVSEAARGEIERRAQQAWKDLQAEFPKALAAGRFDDAEQALERFRTEHARSNHFAAVRGDLDTMKKKCGDARAKHREDAAADLLKKAREAVGKKRWAEATAHLNALASFYPETRAAKDAGIKKLRDDCAREGLSPNLLWKCDFEDDEAPWISDSDTGAPPRFDWAGEAREGSKCGAFTFPAAQGGRYSMLFTTVEQLDAKAEVVSFFAKSKKGTTVGAGVVRLMVVEDDDIMEEWAQDLSLTSEWKRHSVELSKLEMVWSRQPGNRKLDRDRVRRIAFYHEKRGGAAEFLVDMLTVERK